LFGILL